MPKLCEMPFKAKTSRPNCTSRQLLDQLTDTWAILVLSVLADGPARFNTLKRVVDGISQKSLTQTLRGLERHGIVSRTVLAKSPVAVEYALTPLGRTLDGPFAALRNWTLKHLPQVEAAAAAYDAASRKGLR
jgi:DNA-binding HxlR family transcriptional regulator